jgi:succinoglycan biosynthesis transport protein ExoP
MEDEIDLRVYVEVLLRHWLWIVGVAMGAAVVAFVASLLLPPVYEASAVVLVTEPRYQMEFDARLGTEQVQPAYKAFPTLATSDDVLQAVVDVYQPTPQILGDSQWNLYKLRDMAEATSEGDPSLIVLRITSRSAREAADVANAWADVLVKEGNRIYGGTEADLAFFEGQLEQARAALDKTEVVLIEFEARNEADILDAELASLRRAQAEYLAQQRTIAYTIQDIRGLRQQLAEQPADWGVSLGDSLTALFLQMQAFNTSTSSPLQLQIESGAALSDKSREEQVAFLDDLVATLEAKSSEIDSQLAELEPRMLSLQQELQKTTAEAERLKGARDLARETYVTLVRKVDETRIAAQEEKGALQVGSYAAVPEKPVGPRKLLITGVAGMLGLVVGVAGAFVLDYRRRDA